VAPGRARRFAFERWPGVDPALIATIRSQVASAALPKSPVPLIGSDRDEGAVAASRANALAAGVGQDVEWRQGAVSTLSPPGSPGWIVTNPPYGARVGDRTKLRDLYAQFGNVLRGVCPGWKVAMISADRILEGHVGLRWRDVGTTDNGGIPVRFLTGEVPSV
jgi:putative N6-adenine-specific DNA methylase